MYFEYFGKHSWIVRTTHKMINFYFLVTGEWWILLLCKISGFIISKSEIHHFNSFWSSFTIFMNGLYPFKANLTCFNSFRSFALFSSYLYFKGMCQAQFVIITYFHKTTNLLPECVLQCCMSFNALCWKWIRAMYYFQWIPHHLSKNRDMLMKLSE